MKYVVVLVSLFLFLGCAVLEPSFEAISSINVEENTTKERVEKNVSICSKLLEDKTIKNDNLEEGRLILNVFDDELYFEKDKVGKDKNEVVIKYLDAFPWEKKALKNIYKKYQKLWSKKQSKDFRKILEEDKYLSLCADRRYWDNLEFEESEPERDILQSVLLIKYVNNLSHGCPEWVKSDGKIKDENEKEPIKTKQIFSLLPHRVIIGKLLSLYLPKEKKFLELLEEHQVSLESNKKSEFLKLERLKIEAFKCKKCNPNYKRK